MSDKIKYKCDDCENEFYEINYQKEYGIRTNPNCPKCGSSSVSRASRFGFLYKWHYIIPGLIILEAAIYFSYYFNFEGLLTILKVFAAIFAILYVMLFILDHFS